MQFKLYAEAIWSSEPVMAAFSKASRMQAHKLENIYDRGHHDHILIDNFDRLKSDASGLSANVM